MGVSGLCAAATKGKSHTLESLESFDKLIRSSNFVPGNFQGCFSFSFFFLNHFV